MRLYNPDCVPPQTLLFARSPRPRTLSALVAVPPQSGGVPERLVHDHSQGTTDRVGKVPMDYAQLIRWLLMCHKHPICHESLKSGLNASVRDCDLTMSTYPDMKLGVRRHSGAGRGEARHGNGSVRSTPGPTLSHTMLRPRESLSESQPPPPTHDRYT